LGGVNRVSDNAPRPPDMAMLGMGEDLDRIVNLVTAVHLVDARMAWDGWPVLAIRSSNHLLLQPGFRPNALRPPVLMGAPRTRPAQMWRNSMPKDGSGPPSRHAYPIVLPCRIIS
jgi:hypothetical protein